MKQFIIAMFIGCLVGAVYAASVQTVQISSKSSLTGTWVNNASPKSDKTLKGVYFSQAIATNETYGLSLSKSGVTYAILSTNTGLTGTSAYKTFAEVPFVCSYGETVTVTRTVMTTNATLNVMLVVE